MEPKIIKGYVRTHILGSGGEVFSSALFTTDRCGGEGYDTSALLIVSQDGEEPRVWTSEQLAPAIEALKYARERWDNHDGQLLEIDKIDAALKSLRIPEPKQ
jgi:hypothetical protein